jgi:hypothetical protein
MGGTMQKDEVMHRFPSPRRALGCASPELPGKERLT